MAKKKGLLAQQGKFWNGTTAERGQCYRALADHCGKPLPIDQTAEQHALWWQSVAVTLASERWPAFRLPVEWTGKINSIAAGDWLAAGGSDANMPANFDDFYAAQFVVAIEQQRKGRSRNAVFKSLSASTGKARAERESLPRPYRTRSTEGSLREAYDTIRREIRDDPKRFLPIAEALSRDGTTGEVPWQLIERMTSEGKR